jgi:deoxyribose-phosphate aldolase
MPKKLTVLVVCAPMTELAPASSSSTNLAEKIEHTLLSPLTTRADIDRHCAEARTHLLFGVCVSPQWVARASDLLRETTVSVVTVVGFPLGANTSASKAFECAMAIRQGAAEIDMVISLGALKAGDRFGVRDDIASVVKAADGKPVKVILETAYLRDAEKQLACALAEEAGAQFIKTSTGFARQEYLAGPGHSLGATIHDIRLIRACVGERMRVKASGGIRSADLARELVAAGADRIGTSNGPALILQ